MLNTARRLWGGAKKFAPHDFQPKIELTNGLPRVLVTREAYEDMYILVDECSKEVGFLGAVEQVGHDFLLKEIFLFEQEVHATTCEISPNGLAEFATELLSSHEDGMEVANSIRFWGHSHVNMGTCPSGQDDSQLRELAASCGDYFIRAILNKGGRMEFTVYLGSIGVLIKDVEWEVWEPEADAARRARWQAEIADKVREFRPLVTTPIGGYDVEEGNWQGVYTSAMRPDPTTQPRTTHTNQPRRRAAKGGK